ncbi:peptidoglycan D,D-transpeptidase FtsI family protein [Clostridium neuense]|uniref:Peptidoglycan D,D-transpeptidase FtsI family protein n=1 Tax=Clostridium neuense TaxID=1728934 RepID=A0ABW8TKL6_9CLOT
MKKKKEKKLTRFTALIVIILIVFSAICVKLVLLQVIDAQAYKVKANTKAHKFIKESAARGNITDSTGKVLATTKQSYNVTYLETDSTKKVFYNTMAKVFYMLDKNGETQNDDFPIKVNGSTYSFDFDTTDPKEIKIDMIKFLSDRGFKDNIIKNLYGNKKASELTQLQKDKVNSYLLKISPEYVFKKLRGKKGYNIPDSYTINIDGKTISKKCTLDDIRRFMVVRDEVKMQSYSGYNSVAIASNVKRETAISFLQKLNELPGIDIDDNPIRSYPFGKLASNVLGYIGKITPASSDESESYSERGYDVSSDLIGISGLEAAEEDRLKGTAGGRVVEVNKDGRVINEFASKDAYPGQNIKTTINADVQYAAEQALKSSLEYLRNNPNSSGHNSNTANATRGAAVAIDVNTGGVIALASYPNFDPNDFANPNGLSDEAMKKYFPSVEDQIKNLPLTQEQKDFMFPVDKSTGQRADAYDYLAKPLYNYATLGLTPPGSTFKPLTAIAGLETGAITPYTTVDDPGYFTDNGKIIARFDADGPMGTIDLVTAIAKSSNTYFMSVGRWLRQKFGEDIIAKYAWKFGLGVEPNSGINESTGIEIREKFGQVFNSYSIRSNFGQQAVWKVMQDLKNKAYMKRDLSIDLYTAGNDSKELATLKSNVKSEIKNSVIEGKLDKDKFSEALNKFIEGSPNYKGITLSDTDMSSILKGVNNIVLSYAAQARYPANTYNASIGQGNDNFTILQIANYIATIANGGKRYKVHLVDQITDPTNGSVVFKNNPEVIQDTKVSQSTLNTVKEGMKKVNIIGTAAGKFTNFPFETAGKTGTADPYTNEFEQQIGRTSYALYVGFAPADNPKIAVATILYDGGFGSGSTDVAKAMYEAYFNKVEKIANFPKEFPIDAKAETDSSN